jgi:dolichol-phosphate mannosyltransferase
MEVSVVVPLCNEQENLRELYRRVTATMEQQLGVGYELVLVNDGSQDGTVRLIEELQRGDFRVVAIHLSRNFGHQAAISAGIDHASGRAVIVMDGDLQDPPEVLGELIQRWREGFEVVYAVRAKRKESLPRRAGYFLFYRLLRAISDLDIPLDSGDFGLMDRRVVDALKQLPEQQRFVRGLRTFVGYRQCGLSYERAPRNGGRSKYTFGKLVRLAVDGLISFSSFPLSLITYLGAGSAGLALLLTVWAVWDSVARHEAPGGWLGAMIVALFMGALQLFSVGIVGAYVQRIFLETKRRPAYLVREVAGGPPKPGALPAESPVRGAA